MAFDQDNASAFSSAQLELRNAHATFRAAGFTLDKYA
jgi:hypothetical protein